MSSMPLLVQVVVVLQVLAGGCLLAMAMDSSLAALKGMPHWTVKNIGSNVISGLFDVSMLTNFHS